MFSVLCNKCFQQRLQAKGSPEFYMTTCKHILCKNCLQPECPICKRRSRSHIISKDMPKPMAKYFTEPRKMLQHYRRTLQFQLEQQARANHYYVNIQSKQIMKLKKEQNAFIRMEQQLDSTILKEKERIKNLSKYLNYHERRGVGATLQTTSSKREAMSSVHTPTLSSSDT